MKLTPSTNTRLRKAVETADQRVTVVMPVKRRDSLVKAIREALADLPGGHPARSVLQDHARELAEKRVGSWGRRR